MGIMDGNMRSMDHFWGSPHPKTVRYLRRNFQLKKSHIKFSGCLLKSVKVKKVLLKR